MSESPVRIEKGRAGPEEVAAVAAVLMARVAAQPAEASEASEEDADSRANWRRLERTRGFRPPHSWQD